MPVPLPHPFKLILTTVLTTLLLSLSVALAAPAGSGPKPAPDPFFGVAPQTPVGEADAEVMAQGNIGSIRIPFDWRTVEPEEDGPFDWRPLDGLFEVAASRGIQILPTMNATPDWVNPVWKALPTGRYAIKRWRQMLRAAVDRYGPRGDFWLERPKLDPLPVRVWQIWNEPNIRYWAKPVSAARYVRLLKASAGAIHSVDPGAKIMLAGLYGDPPPGKGPASYRFLSALYRVPGFRDAYDIAAVHPYARSTRGAMKLVNRLRRRMDRAHEAHKDLAITEIGWNSDAKTAFGRRTPEAQAQALTQVYRRLIRARNRLELSGIYWFTWKDIPYGTPSCAFCHRSGLFDVRDGLKPAWSALMAFTGGF